MMTKQANASPSKRLFFALPLSPMQKQVVHNWREQALPDLAKPVAMDNLHLTLRYIGNCQAKLETALKRAADSIRCAPLEFNLDLLGHFKKPKVLYLGVSDVPRGLSQLADNVSDLVDAALLNAGDKANIYKFTPHITIARKVSYPVRLSMPVPINLKIEKFSLFESVSTNDGVVYNERMSWPLKC